MLNKINFEVLPDPYVCGDHNERDHKGWKLLAACVAYHIYFVLSHSLFDRENADPQHFLNGELNCHSFYQNMQGQ